MHIVFIQNVMNFGGAARCTIELCKRLKPHADLSIVDYYGGNELYIEAARKAGIDFHVLCPKYSRTFVGGHGKPLLRMWRLLAYTPQLLRVRARMKKVLANLNPSVICTDCKFTAAIIASCRSLRCFPLAMYLKGWCTPQQLRWHGRWVCKKGCTGIIALSHATQAAAHCAGVPLERISVLEDPMSVEDMRVLASRPLDAPLPQVDRPVRLLLPADIKRAKGQHVAVQAMRRILDAGHDAVLWLAGNFTPMERGKKHRGSNYLEETKALAEKIGVADRVEWIGLRHDLPQVINACTILVLPSHSEGQSRVVLEAMSLAKPIAATPVGGVMDMIVPGMTGQFFDVEDDKGLAACVDSYVKNPHEAERIGKTAQEYLQMSFTTEQKTRQALEIFSRVAKM